MGCSFTLDSQCGRLWLYQPPATGTHTGVWHPAGNEQGPAATTESACAKRRCALHPGGLLPGCQERRSRRDRGGATGTVAASRGFTHRTVATARNRASGFGGDWRVRQQLPVGVGPDDRMPPGSREPKVRRQTGQHCSSQNQSSREKNNNIRIRVITSEKNMPDTAQTGRVTGDASAWPASLPAVVSLPGVFTRADRRPPPPALVSPVSAALKDVLTAQENSLLIRHKIADFINNLRGGERFLPHLTTSCINHGLVITQNFAGFRADVHFSSPPLQGRHRRPVR